jgi:hypothetical protein
MIPMVASTFYDPLPMEGHGRLFRKPPVPQTGLLFRLLPRSRS